MVMSVFYVDNYIKTPLSGILSVLHRDPKRTHEILDYTFQYLHVTRATLGYPYFYLELHTGVFNLFHSTTNFYIVQLITT